MADVSAAERTRGSRARRFLRVAGIIAAALAIFVIVAVVALQSPPARRYVQAKVTELLAAQDITFSGDELRYNLFDLSANVRHVRVVSRRLPDAPPFLEIDRVRVDLSSWQVLRGRYVVQGGSAEGVRVHYFVNEQGVDNLPRPPSNPDDPGRPINYLIADLNVPNARIRYEDRARHIDAIVPAATLTMNGDALTDRHDVTIEATSGDVTASNRTWHLDRVSAVLDLGREDVRIERAQIDAEGASMNASGTLGPFEQPIADLAVQATVDAARAAEAASVDERISGQASLEASIKGATDALEIEARVSGSDLQIRELTALNVDAAGTYQMGADHLRVSRLNVRSPAGAISGSGEIVVRGPGESSVNLAVDDLDAEPFMRSARLPYRVATRVDGRVNARWPALEYAAAVGDATLSLTPTRNTPAVSTLPIGGHIDITGNGDRVAATLRDVRAAGARVDGRVNLSGRKALSGALQLRSADLERSIDALEAFLGRPRGSLLPTPVAGALTADARIGGTVAAPVVNATVTAPALAVGDAADIDVKGLIAYRRDAVTIETLDIAWPVGDVATAARAHVTGTIGLIGSRPLNLSARADSLQVPELLRALQRAEIPASGSLSATANIRGTVTNPAGTVELRGADLIAYNEVWGTLASEARLAGRRIDVVALTIDKPQPGGNGRVTGTGAYQFDTRSFAVDLQSSNVKLLSLTLPGGRSVVGGVDFAARGGGTITNPSGTVNVRGSELVVGDYAVGDITADTTVANQIAETVARADRFSLVAKSSIRTTTPYAATITAEISNLDLAALPLRLQTPLAGQLTARVDAQGPLSDPQRGRAEAVIETLTGEWHQQPFTVETPARLLYADERLTIDRLRLTARDSTIEVSGNLPVVDRSAPGKIAVDARANLATLIQYAPVGTNVAADGRVTLTGTLQGTLEAIDPDLRLVLENALILSPEIEPGLSNVAAAATIADGAATIEQLHANWGTAQINMSGRVPLDLLPELPVAIPRADGPATLKASLDDLDPSAIPGAPAGVSGRISLDADVASSRPDLRELEGKVTFRDLQLGFNGLTLEQKATSTLAVRQGIVSVEQFTLGGSAGTLAATGTVGLTGSRPIDLDVNGDLNIAAVSLITDRVRAEGASTIEIAANGTVADPMLSGNVTVRDGTVVIDEPRIAAEALNARLDLDGNRVTVSSLSAAVNGGSFTGKGTLAVGASGLRDVDLELATREFAFDAPLDLRSLSDSDIRIVSQGDDIVVSGQVTIQEAGLTGDINFDTGLLATVTARPHLELTPQRNPLLERVLFNVNVDTATPVLVDNNVAKAEVTTDLRVVGTPYETGLLGRLDILDGGLVTLNERTFEVERGHMTFVEDRRIFPSFDLLMNTSAGNYDITLGVSGEPGNTETTLTSNPPLPEPDIMAMIVTGRTLEQMRGEEYDVAREQVFSYLTGRVGSTLGRGIEEATGFDEVRIEPHLIANEADPGARLTLSEDINDEVTLTYSVDLVDSDDQIWMATYDVTRRFQTRALRQSDNSYRADFRHDVRKGGTPEPRRVPRVRPDVVEITVPDDAPLPPGELRSLLGAKEGKDFDYFAVRSGVDEIEERLREAGWAQSRVRLDRVNADDGVRLHLRIIRGPQVEFSYAGATPPRKIQEEVRLQWHRGVFDAQRTDDARETLVEWLMRDDYLQGQVTFRIDDSDPNRRRVHFDVVPGQRSSKVLLVFQGASGIPADELNQVIDDQNLERQLFTDPTVVTELLQQLYRERGFLNAEIDRPRYEFEGPTARVVLEVREGPQFTVSSVRFTGRSAVPESTLTTNLPVAAGDPFRPAAAENALQFIRDRYWERGYNDVRAAYQLLIDRIAGNVGVTFSINEGRQSLVTGIRVAGNDITSERLVREQLIVHEGEPLDLKALSRSRKNLYDTGAFSIVDLSRDTVIEAADASAEPGVIGAITGEQPPQKPVVVDVTVREVQPYQFRYGASYDTEGQLGGVLDASAHNVLGKARVVGLSARYDSQLTDGRIFLSQPTLLHWPIQTTASVYYRDERNPPTETTEPFNIDRRGVSIQQERKLKNAYVWTYGYRFERARTFDPQTTELGEFSNVSPLTSAFVREGRDDVLDATRGSFSSHAFSYSPRWLGSDGTYLKYFGQYSHYFPLQRERRRPFSNEIIRPRFVFATGIRVGLSKGMGTFVPVSERFFAGGSTTVRGFEQNALGPISVTGRPLGGDAVLILNNELRFPLFSIVDGVTFLDVGNVFERTKDFGFTDLRKAAGVGLRLRTKWVLVRTDYGFVLDRRPGEPRSRFFFSIGQAF